MSSGPFIHSGRTTRRLMWQVLAALLPVSAAGVWRHGPESALVLGAALAASWLVEAVALRRRPAEASALVTGTIVWLVLPVESPWWLGAVAGAVAVGLGKHAFGGLGRNPFNPAALSRVLLTGLMPSRVLAIPPVVDGISQATPLAKEMGTRFAELGALIGGSAAGSFAEASPVAVLAGGAALVLWKTIDWRVPVAYLTVLGVASLLLPAGLRVSGHAPWLAGAAAVHLVAGGGLFAAFFMLTDPVTAPFTPGGRIVFGGVAGVATIAIRYYTPYPDGVACAVLLANACVPLIDRATIPGLRAPSVAGGPSR